MDPFIGQMILDDGWEAEQETKLRQRNNYSNLWNTLIEIMTRSKPRTTARRSCVLKKSLEAKKTKEKYLSPFARYGLVHELDEQPEEVYQKEDSGDNLVQILATITTLTSSVILSSATINKSLSHGSNVVEAPWSSTQKLEGHDPGEGGRDLNHLLSLSTPSPVSLGIVMLVYGAGTSTIYHLNRNDPFQDTILIVGISFGLIAGILVGHKFEAIILHILPWAVFLALSLSGSGHRIARAAVRKREAFEDDLIV